MLDATADRLDRRGDYVATVGDRRRPEHQHELGAVREHFFDRLGERGLLVRHTPLGDDLGAGRRQPLLRHLQGLLDHLGGKARQHGRHNADLANAIRRDPQQRTGRLRHRKRRVPLAPVDGERNDLDGRDHLARHHRLESGQGRKRDRLVDAVEPVDRVLVDHQHAGALGKQIGAAGERAIDPDAGPRHHHGDLRRGGVLGNVARLAARHHDFGDPGGLERGDLGLTDHRALLQHEAALADRMNRDCALGFADRYRAELHEAFSSTCSGCCRSRAVISPMIATAISAGDTAPMSSPIGAWMRPSAASAKPSALSRSRRRPCVFREPSAPM